MKSTSKVRGSTSALTGFPFTVRESRTGMGIPSGVEMGWGYTAGSHKQPPS
jgi:hypothetical protein